MNCIEALAGMGRMAVRRARAALLTAACMPAVALADRAFNLPPPVTPIARQIFELHLIIFIICVVIFIVVFGVMFYSIYAHRRSKGHVAAQFHENTSVEIIWTIIPFLILAG